MAALAGAAAGDRGLRRAHLAEADTSLVDTRVDTPDDERLRHLLDVEQRLQELVREAEEEGRRRVAAARAAGDRRLEAARAAAARADAEQARSERIDHERELASIETAHQAALAAIAAVSDDRVDVLARWALERVITGDGDTA